MQTIAPLLPALDSPNLSYTDWTVIETQFCPALLHSRETVFTIGNGYLGTRGSFEEGYPQDISATLIHGVFDDVPIVYTELANCPDGLPVSLSINGEAFRLDQDRRPDPRISCALLPTNFWFTPLARHALRTAAPSSGSECRRARPPSTPLRRRAA